MITLRQAEQRGHAHHGWLEAYHSFSFAEYYDPAHMGFRTLRVINEDRVQPRRGFPPHSHQNMEIVTYVIQGALEHQDNMGNQSVILPGEVQRMTAGTGVTHSEYNHSAEELVHLLQIWILPERRGLTPGYEQKSYKERLQPGAWTLLASRDGREDSVTVYQDLSLWRGDLNPGQSLSYEPAAGRNLWVQVVRGALTLNGEALKTSDGAAISGEASLKFQASQTTEVLVFDLA